MVSILGASSRPSKVDRIREYPMGWGALLDVAHHDSSKRPHCTVDFLDVATVQGVQDAAPVWICANGDCRFYAVTESDGKLRLEYAVDVSIGLPYRVRCIIAYCYGWRGEILSLSNHGCGFCSRGIPHNAKWAPGLADI